ncbi:MAG: hypothetical protein AB1894_11315 [Chloroflexota bacterium]
MPNFPQRGQASDRFRQTLEKQYAQAMRQALKDFNYLGNIPEQADAQTLASAVREIVSYLESKAFRDVLRTLPYRVLDREMHRLREDNERLRQQNDKYFAQIKSMSEVVARLQDRLDQGENGG